MHNLDGLWNVIQGFSKRGIEGRKCALLLTEYLDVVSMGMKAFDAARVRLAAAALSKNEVAIATAMLEGASRRAVEIRDRMVRIKRLLETPPREIDPASLPAGRDDPDAPGYISMDEFRAQFLSGGNP